MLCFESLIDGSDVIAVLPTGCVGYYSPEFDHGRSTDGL